MGPKYLLSFPAIPENRQNADSQGFSMLGKVDSCLPVPASIQILFWGSLATPTNNQRLDKTSANIVNNSFHVFFAWIAQFHYECQTLPS